MKISTWFIQKSLLFFKDFSREKSHFQQAKTTTCEKRKFASAIFQRSFQSLLQPSKGNFDIYKNTYYSETKPAAYLMLAAELAEANLTASSRRGSAASIPGFSPS